MSVTLQQVFINVITSSIEKHCCLVELMKWSLICCQAFSVVFEKAIDRAEPAEEIKQRVLNLIDCITFSVYVYTTRGLFEKDKIIFTAQMTFQVSHTDLLSVRKSCRPWCLHSPMWKILLLSSSLNWSCSPHTFIHYNDIIVTDNGLSSQWHQDIWTNVVPLWQFEVA